jgi:hypothetical protein
MWLRCCWGGVAAAPGCNPGRVPRATCVPGAPACTPVGAPACASSSSDGVASELSDAGSEARRGSASAGGGGGGDGVLARPRCLPWSAGCLVLPPRRLRGGVLLLEASACEAEEAEVRS